MPFEDAVSDPEETSRTRRRINEICDPLSAETGQVPVRPAQRPLEIDLPSSPVPRTSPLSNSSQLSTLNRPILQRLNVFGGPSSFVAVMAGGGFFGRFISIEASRRDEHSEAIPLCQE
jgi:hypothetical protein